MKEIMQCTVTSKRIKYLGINLPKEAKDLYLENYKILIKEIKAGINRWRSMFWDWKNQYYQNDYTTESNLQIQSNPYQIINDFFFTELEKDFVQFVWKHKRPQINKAVSKKENRAGGIRLPTFRLSYIVTVIRALCYRHKNRNIDQWNRTQSAEINLHTYSRLINDKIGKNIQWKKDSLFNKFSSVQSLSRV